MILNIIRNNEKIIVESYSIKEFKYKNKIFKSYFINNQFRLKQDDKLSFICEKCGNINNNKKFKKFYLEYLLCSKCKREQTTLIKYGVNSTNQLNATKEKIKQTKLKNHGDEHYNNKTKREQTNLEKYGVKNILENITIKEKIKQTNLDKYGVENVMKSPEIKNKAHASLLQKYGGIGSASDLIKEKIKQTNLEKYGVENAYQIQTTKSKLSQIKLDISLKKIITNKEYEFLSKIENYNGILLQYKWRCLSCNTIFESNLNHGGPWCPICYPKQKSIPEKEIVDFIKSLGITNIIENSRSIIPPQELDIYLPDYKLAIEYNGLYWHSINLGTDKNYHLNKTIECEKQGIRLLHIFEDEWIDKQDIVLARLKNILGKNEYRIGARLCEIKEISYKEKENFLKTYHIQGGDKSAIKIGAYYKDKLIGVMTFGKLRKFMNKKNKQNIWELIRFATISNTYTPGLASKMLKYFETNWKPEKIESFADKRWSCGDLYHKLNFILESETPPNYFYFQNNKKRYHRYNFRKNKLKKFFNYSDDKTEKEIMEGANYFRIYDCGNYKFIKLFISPLNNP